MNGQCLRAAVADGCTSRRQVVMALGLLALLLVPALRQWLTASMWRHMVLQFPLWMLAGALLVADLSPKARVRICLLYTSRCV